MKLKLIFQVQIHIDMKFNWGWGIFIVLVLFIAFIGNLVYKSSQVRVDLVSENYYEKEIKYQHQIESEKNTH